MAFENMNKLHMAIRQNGFAGAISSGLIGSAGDGEPLPGAVNDALDELEECQDYELAMEIEQVLGEAIGDLLELFGNVGISEVFQAAATAWDERYAAIIDAPF
jgi:hypothetical protein